MRKPRGRPAGQIKTEKIEVKVSPETKKLFQELVAENGSNCSVVLNAMIRKYITECSIGREVRHQ